MEFVCLSIFVTPAITSSSIVFIVWTALEKLQMSPNFVGSTRACSILAFTESA
uniref:Uncharacterized protein n=1 Tax=Physcomitrium patens TaxID=3218 RepID=A0A2K1KJH1_PHYPA|nr:hypothetical protein PHYPA_007603 [Physcomitrium patens]